MPGRVLIVEDNHDTAESIAILLRLHDIEPLIVTNGPAALKIAQENDVDVVLLDLGLPLMNGLEVARRLRSLHSDLFIIACTGMAGEHAIALSKHAGIDLHLVKPVDPTYLF
jgi:two-component system CheB/CheR fusion protein